MPKNQITIQLPLRAYPNGGAMIRDKSQIGVAFQPPW